MSQQPKARQQTTDSVRYYLLVFSYNILHHITGGVTPAVVDKKIVALGTDLMALLRSGRRDQRVHSPQNVFLSPTTALDRSLAQQRNRAFTEDWGFFMNMDVESSKSLFDKFATTGA